MGNTVPVQSEKQQSPEQTLHLPPAPASSKGMPAQMRFSTPPATEKLKNDAAEPVSPYIPYPVPPPAEDETFLFATRHALELALGKDTLEHLEVLLQREKKLTQDYIEHLEEAINQKNGIESQMQNTLVQKQIAHWRAKAEGHSENTKTEMRLLRDWNVRIKEEKDNLEEEVNRLRQESGILKAEIERLKGGRETKKGHDEYENERLRQRNAQLEVENDTKNANFQMMQEDFMALRAEMDRMRNDSSPEHKQEEPDVTMKDSHGQIAGDNATAPTNISKNRQRNLKKRAREKKRREYALVQERNQFSAKVAQMESEYTAAHAAALAANEERLVKLQTKIEELEREVRSRDERVERQRHTPAPAPVAVPAPSSASKRKSKKMKVKKEQKKKEESE